MSTERKTGKVTLDIELKDLIDVVSQMGGGASNAPISDISQRHAVEAEDLRKAWFKHTLINIEGLSAAIEKLRSQDIPSLKKELENDIEKLETRISKDEEKLETYKETIIKPLSDGLLTLTVKFGLWGILAGFVGSGILTLLSYLIKTFFSSAVGVNGN